MNAISPGSIRGILLPLQNALAGPLAQELIIASTYSLSDEMVALLKSGRINNRLLCEPAIHKDFIKFLADIEVSLRMTNISAT